MISMEFVITALVVVLVPGTGVIYTVSTGLTGNRKSGIAAAAGCTLGIIPHLTTAITGLSAVLHMSAQAFQIIKFAGCLYLLFLAWTMWNSSDSVNMNGKIRNGSILKIIIKGLLINILNPKLTLFFFAFLPVFIKPEAGEPLKQMVLLGLVFMGMTFAVFALYALLANLVQKYIPGTKFFLKKVHRTFSVIILILAVKLSFSRQ
ncbi:MAG: LysE family translocator [Spirochaetes bacterium]|nr:LysE family translocator [Spirochaetota bacterium]